MPPGAEGRALVLPSRCSVTREVELVLGRIAAARKRFQYFNVVLLGEGKYSFDRHSRLTLGVKSAGALVEIAAESSRDIIRRTLAFEGGKPRGPP